MSSTKYKIIYSLRLHMELQRLGFKAVTEMKNPGNTKFNCWVYEDTEAFSRAFDSLLRKEP